MSMDCTICFNGMEVERQENLSSWRVLSKDCSLKGGAKMKQERKISGALNAVVGNRKVYRWMDKYNRVIIIFKRITR